MRKGNPSPYELCLISARDDALERIGATTGYVTAAERHGFSFIACAHVSRTQ
ncbi:MAG: hypothetical protein ACYCUE_05520 [Steroidobacteraceae bacterium]